jgi:hypothetical protein
MSADKVREREEHEGLKVGNGRVGAVGERRGGESAGEGCLASGDVAGEECASRDFLGRSVSMRVGIVGRLGRCRNGCRNGRGHSSRARPLALGRKGIVENVTLVVGIWVSEEMLDGMERGRGLQEGSEKIRLVGSGRGEW